MLVLVAGLPGAGKTTFANYIEQANIGFTHIPMDKYIKPIPDNKTFLEWVKHPDCVDWALLQQHLKLLNNKQICYTPKPDWNQRGKRLDEGGINKGPGRLLKPANRGYIIPGTHVFSFPDTAHLKIFIKTSPEALAIRLANRHNETHSQELSPRITIHKYLGSNPAVLHPLESCADYILDGTQNHKLQLKLFLEFIKSEP